MDTRGDIMGKMNLKNPKKKKFKIRYLLYLTIIYLSFAFTFYYGFKDKEIISNEEFISMILKSNNPNMLSEYQAPNVINSTVKFFLNLDFSNPSSLLNIHQFKDKNNETKETPTEETITIEHNDDYSNMEELEEISKYIEDPNPVDTDNPIIYIYNSHQLENYDSANLEIYGITPNVLMASYILKEKLNDKGLSTIVEDTDMTEFLRINNWDHSSSYKASRLLILDKQSKYSSLKYFIDIHRDSVTKDVSTITINDKRYARILFVVGLDHDNYQPNLDVANAINDIANKSYSGLSRGVLTKTGLNVDGVYNQDLSPNSILIEVGGYENNIEEVFNTIEALSDILYKYIGDQNG